ncbi:glycosyltransferase family 4 protein [Spirosoma sp. SC4-14]|uniref:glycosyltransferase family 4 protein n=1 Tax=Spirosoma sp. SC4-14 TaxID=3128900 RepID=UPI0030D32518
MANILSVISVCGKAGGTTVKLKKLIEESRHNHSVYFALYDKEAIKDYPKNKIWFKGESNVKVFEGFYGRNFIRHAFKVYEIAKENNIDVIHFYFNFENTFAPILKVLYPKAILVRSIVGFDEPLSKARSYLLGQVLKPIDQMIHISKYIKNLYETDYPILKDKKNTIIYNTGIHVTENISEPDYRQKLVSISGLCARKNLAVLIKAMKIVVIDNKIDCKLYILGDGPSRKELEALIGDLNLANNVILVGYSTDVTTYLNDCKIYVHPANTEGFGIAVTEAMYMKCPSIVSNAGALPELVVDGVTGYVVDPYDEKQWSLKIIELLQNKQLCNQMAYEAHDRALNTFPLSGFVNNHDLLYDKLVNVN